MRLLAEEKKSGTLELLLTKAITDRNVIIGKFLAALLLVCIALAFTLPYVITLASIGKIDIGGIICGYIGLVLVSASYISIGLYASSITTNQIVAFLSAIFIGLFFQIIFQVMAGSATGLLGEIFSTLNLQNHFESISRGVIDSKDIIYFASIIFLGIFLSELSISKRKIAG